MPVLRELTDTEREDAGRRWADRESLKTIAADLGVTHNTVWRAVQGVRTRGDRAKLSERQRQHVRDR